MKCNEVKNELMLITNDNEMTSSLSEHLARCADCKAYYEETKNILKDFASDDLFTLSGSETEDIINNVNRKLDKTNPKIISLYRYFSMAAAVILVLGVTYIARQTGEFDRGNSPLYSNSDSINTNDNIAKVLNGDDEMYDLYLEQLNLENSENNDQFWYYLSEEDFEYLEDNFDVKELLL